MKRAWLAAVVLMAGACACAAPGVQAPVSAQGAGREIGSVREALALSGRLAGSSGPASVNWIDEGDRFSYTRRNPQTGVSEVLRYDPTTLADQALFDPNVLTLPGTQEPLAYRSFAFGQDSRFLVFQSDFRPIYRTSGIADYFVFDLADESLVLAADDARTAELSPTGGQLAYEREGDLFVYDLGAERERRLTNTGNDSVWNGVFDWVYEEEFGMSQAWSWSRDGRRIAYWQTHVADVPTIQLTDYEGQYPEYTVMPYPKVGEENAVVRIGVVDVAAGAESAGGVPRTRWLNVAIEDEHYIPRIYWTSDPNTLAVVTMNRPQNHLRLFFFDVRDGSRRLVMEERSEAWIDVMDFFAGVDDYFYFPEGVDEFFWISDRDGWNHLYRYSYDGRLLNRVTSGDWVVTRVEAIDPSSGTVYYTGTEEAPLERHLYAIGFDGSNKRKLTPERGSHDIDMSPNGRYYIDRWSNSETPRQVELWTTADGGRRLEVLEDNASVRQFVSQNAYSPVELFSFTTSDGQRLDGSMIRPPNFDATKPHPVLVSIYGGPGSQQVYDQWATNGWHQYLAQQGYIVVGLNNRGSGNYGRDFMEVVYEDLGRWEANDFAEVARWLGQQPWADADRMAIQGTSYGGYMAISTLFRHPGVYALGIANSPVTDWRLYDTIYTERYMGLLPENAAQYDAASTLTKVDALEDELLLIHSAMDENVHPQNTMQLLTELAKQGKDADFRYYPPGAHGAAFDMNSFVTMTEVYTNALCQYIATACRPMNLNADGRPAT